MEETDIRRHLEALQFSEAFGLLHERLQEKVFRLAFSILRDETRAEDAAQDIFIRIWKGLPAYHGGASLSTWVYTITRNTCLTELKGHRRHPSVSLQEPGMAATMDGIESLQLAPAPAGLEMDVENLLAELPDHYRQVIILFYLEQKAYEEVAQMLGVPLGTVKTLIFRAKKELLQIHARRERRMMPPGNHLPAHPKPVATDAMNDLHKDRC